MWKKLAIALAVVMVVGAIVISVVPLKEVAYTATKEYQEVKTYYEQQTYTDTEQYTTVVTRQVPLYSTTVAVEAGTHQFAKYYIDIANKINNVVNGNISVLAGGEFLFYVFDQRNYNAWRDGQSYQAVVSPGRVTNYSFAFIPDHSDYYYFVFANNLSLYSNKMIQSSAYWGWQESQIETREVTEYRYVPKEVTVCGERTETAYKKVSILDYSLHY